MATIGVRDFRAALAVHLRRVSSGERITLTSGGVPVAEVSPVGGRSHDATLVTLVAAGRVEAPRRRSGFRPGEPVPVRTGTRIDRALGEVRK